LTDHLKPTQPTINEILFSYFLGQEIHKKVDSDQMDTKEKGNVKVMHSVVFFMTMMAEKE
jgi:hypothetical protein